MIDSSFFHEKTGEKTHEACRSKFHGNSSRDWRMAWIRPRKPGWPGWRDRLKPSSEFFRVGRRLCEKRKIPGTSLISVRPVISFGATEKVAIKGALPPQKAARNSSNEEKGFPFQGQCSRKGMGKRWRKEISSGRFFELERLPLDLAFMKLS